LAELDALVALLYGLTEDDLSVIFETFHVGWDPAERLAMVIKHHRELRGLILDAWEPSAK
jgi:hypothetical protein